MTAASRQARYDTVAATECRLCGAPTPAPPPVEDGGHAFCCYGCSTVFRTFGDAILDPPAREASPSAPEDPEGAAAYLRIDGMHCASCEFLLRRAARKVDGIISVTANYATGTAKVVYDPERIRDIDLPAALSPPGYRARLRADGAPEYDERKPLLRLLVGAGIAGVVMMLYLAFFYPTNLGLVDPAELAPVGWLAFDMAPKLMWVLATLQILLVGTPIMRGAWTGLRAGVLNMDNLLILAILSAYGYSVGQLWIGSHDLYFDVSVVIIAVVTAGRFFERGAKARAAAELNEVIDKCTNVVHVVRDGAVVDADVHTLGPGERVMVHAGETIALDGTVVAGDAAVDESLMTGEPVPVRRGPGEKVVGGGVVVEGYLELQVGPRVESQLDNLARVLWNLQSSGGGIEGMADRIARVFVPVVLVLSAAVFGWSLLTGAAPGDALLAAMATLIVSCPCTFGLAVPLTTANAVSAALRNGIIITSGRAFTRAPRIDTVGIDKTGTLSTGRMGVVDVIGPPGMVDRAVAVERLSTHPIARAIARLPGELEARGLHIHPGKGAEAVVQGERVVVGSGSLFATLGWEMPEDIGNAVMHKTPDGAVASYVGWEGRVQGAIVTRDEHRADWEKVVSGLRERVRVVLLTGAEHPDGYEAQVDECYTGVPPEAKAAVIRQLRTSGRVAMIGDGTNDAPALAAADLGIAFGATTELAADAADIVIPSGNLDRVFTAFNLITTASLRVRQNIGWALLYNGIAIPLAVTGLLNPLFAALAMATSSALVVWNSSRPFGAPQAEESGPSVTPLPAQ